MLMHRLLRAFFALLAMVCFAPNLSAAETSLLMEQVTLTSGNPSLARHWSRHDAVCKKAHPFNAVWKVNCDRTGIPCTEKAWRTQVQPGTVVYLPAPKLVVLAPRGVTAPEAIALVPSSTEGVLALAPATPVVIAAHNKAESALRARVQALAGHVHALDRQQKSADSRATLFGVLFLVAIGILFFLARRRKINADTELRMRNHISDLQEDLVVMTRDRDRLRQLLKPAELTTRVQNAALEAVENSGQPADTDAPLHSPAVRSIELTCETSGEHGTALDSRGDRYRFSTRTVGHRTLKVGDVFTADVSADRRVVLVFFSPDGVDESGAEVLQMK